MPPISKVVPAPRLPAQTLLLHRLQTRLQQPPLLIHRPQQQVAHLHARLHALVTEAA